MAFYPAHCDNICKECEKNKSGWCIWKDIAVCNYSETINTTKINPELYKPKIIYY